MDGLETVPGCAKGRPDRRPFERSEWLTSSPGGPTAPEDRRHLGRQETVPLARQRDHLPRDSAGEVCLEPAGVFRELPLELVPVAG